ncbi:MAG: nuclear transport factor 2 family protein [Thermoleophilia bacterium]|nr:nuclear transport factor 2 family protein [Thermoleophilia bacterium]
MKFSRAADMRRKLITIACAMAILLGLGVLAGPVTANAAQTSAAKSGVLKGNPTNKRLATEFLRLLKAEDTAGLKRFLDPAFLLQRASGEYLTKSQYLADPSVVEDFRVRGVVGKRSGKVRVIRFEANNIQTIDGVPVPAAWIPRISTFSKESGAWRLIGHANFTEPVAI